jgi:hypothetical protein
MQACFQVISLTLSDVNHSASLSQSVICVTPSRDSQCSTNSVFTIVPEAETGRAQKAPGQRKALRFNPLRLELKIERL